MKYKIGLIIVSILIVILVICFIDYKNNKTKELEIKPERTKIEYIFDNMSYNQALEMGEDRFLKAIKLAANDYFDYKKESNDYYKKYYINNEYYVEVINYGSIREFLNKQSIDDYNNLFGYLYYEKKDYIKKYSKSINDNYVGSVLSIDSYDNLEIRYTVNNYYCNDYHFVGILNEEPKCNIENITNTSFSLIKEGSILKIKDFNEFINNKIY